MSLDKFVMRGFTASTGSGHGQGVARSHLSDATPSNPPLLNQGSRSDYSQEGNHCHYDGSGAGFPSDHCSPHRGGAHGPSYREPRRLLDHLSPEQRRRLEHRMAILILVAISALVSGIYLWHTDDSSADDGHRSVYSEGRPLWDR